MIQTNSARSTSIKPSDLGQAYSWLCRSRIASFVHTLHLLDLDLRDDWPQITAHTFSTRSAQQNLQLRIRATEWSLYQLLELWNAKLVREKLRPFFPPQSPLQSQNLRAALLRVLTDLKSNGSLPKDTLLRKTTFDECKGEKFEELLFNVSQTVLTKIHSLSSTTAALSSEVAATNVVPLIIAHKVVLSNAIRKRHAAITDYRQQVGEVTNARVLLGERRLWLDDNPRPSDDSRNLVENILRDAWPGEKKWTKAILTGRPSQRTVSESQTDSASVTQLDSLRRDVLNQQIYAKRLRHIRETLPVNTDKKKPSFGSRTAKPAMLHFDAHLQGGSRRHMQDSQQYHKADTTGHQCEELLRNMEHELLGSKSSLTTSAGTFGTAQDDLKDLPSIGPKNVSPERSCLHSSPPASTEHGSKNEIARPVETVHKNVPLSSSPPIPEFPTESRQERPSSPVFPAQTACTVGPELPSPAAANLVERTRKSLALLSNRPTAKSQPSHVPRAHPVNPFETPSKQIPRESCRLEPLSGGSTPREVLFSDDVDISSVFKSRPKLAVSPALSPDRDVLAPDSDDLVFN